MIFQHYAADQIEAGSYGAPPLTELLHIVQPRYWFAAHYHVKYPATVKHQVSAKLKQNQSVNLPSLHMPWGYDKGSTIII